MNRICRTCKIEQSLEMFYVQRHIRNGKIYIYRQHKCKACHNDETNQRKKERMVNDPEYLMRYNDYHRNYQRNYVRKSV